MGKIAGLVFLFTSFLITLLAWQNLSANNYHNTAPDSPMMITQQPLAANQAFQLSVTVRDVQTLLIHWQIAPGYYLYRHGFYFTAKSSSGIELGPPLFPPSEIKIIDTQGQFAIYQHSLTIGLPILHSTQPMFAITVRYQGCSQQGYCYPPITTQLPIDLNAISHTAFKAISIPLIENTISPQSHTEHSLYASLNQHHWLLSGLSFFALGLLLSCTPCMLPMIPILSAIILGQRHASMRQHLSLSLTYVLSMALTYAGIGYGFGWLGYNLQTSLQQSSMIILVSIILLLMALSLLEIYSLQWPTFIRNRLHQLNQRQHGGHFGGVAVMGCLSTLILSPCVTPPLVAALSYIGQTGHAALGAYTLFMLGLGMGMPLLAVGVFGPKLLPAPGPWMQRIRHLLAIMLLGLTIWVLSRILPYTATILLFCAWLVGIAVYAGALRTAHTRHQWIGKIAGLGLFFYSSMLLLAIIQDHLEWLRPTIKSLSPTTSTSLLTWNSIHSMQRLQSTLAAAPSRPALLDIYADWCITCKQIDHQIFKNTRIQLVLQQHHYLLIRADVTANTSAQHTLQRDLHVIGPPTLLFFDASHQEIRSARIVGAISPQQFLKTLSTISNSNASS